jgi:uncharacterized phiE125 gp8 family phage protein
MKVQLVSASTSKAVSLDDVKDWLRLERGYTDEDDILRAMRDAAVNRCEEYVGRKLITQTWNVFFNHFPAGNQDIVIPWGPLQNLVSTSTSVIYTDSDSSTVTFASSNYSVDTVSDNGRVVLNYGELWPTATLARNNPIQIDFVTGYGDNSSDVEPQIKNGIKRYIGDLHEHREDTLVGQGVTVVEIPYGVADMWRPFKLNTGAF